MFDQPGRAVLVVRYAPYHFALEVVAADDRAIECMTDGKIAIPGAIDQPSAIRRKRDAASLALLLILVIVQDLARTRINNNDPAARGLHRQSLSAR